MIRQIISSGGSIYTVWSDGTHGNYDILFKKGVDLKARDISFH